jgi:hypothetical protein
MDERKSRRHLFFFFFFRFHLAPSDWALQTRIFERSFGVTGKNLIFFTTKAQIEWEARALPPATVTDGMSVEAAAIVENRQGQSTHSFLLSLAFPARSSSSQTFSRKP